jgi:hypothetical protein
VDKAPDPPLMVRQVEALAFGRVTVRKEMGFVTIDPKTGAKRVRGAGDLGGQHAVAEFMVRGEPGRRFRITLPEVVPVRGRAMRRARLQDFRSEPAEAGRLGADGKAVLRVGATLRLPADAHGKFDQPFDIFVDYED